MLSDYSYFSLGFGRISESELLSSSMNRSYLEFMAVEPSNRLGFILSEPTDYNSISTLVEFKFFAGFSILCDN